MTNKQFLFLLSGHYILEDLNGLIVWSENVIVSIQNFRNFFNSSENCVVNTGKRGITGRPHVLII